MGKNDNTNSLCSVYIYKTENSVGAGQLSSLLNNNYKSIIETIYDKFTLEDYVIKAHGEDNNKHPDIVPKLMALIYQEEGFIAVLRLLSPFLEKNVNYDCDYKTILQEYAQSKKLNVYYSLENEEGPEHAKYFTIKVVVGDKYTTTKALGKKNAEKEAARCFIRKYKITNIFRTLPFSVICSMYYEKGGVA